MATPVPLVPPITSVIVGIAIGILALAPAGLDSRPQPSDPPVGDRGVVVATWNAPEGDLVRVRKLDVSTIVAPVRDSSEVPPLLREAAALDLRVILFIRDPSDPESPAPPRQIEGFVKAARGHPALLGYLSAVEPHHHGLRLRDLRQRYDAYKRLDPESIVVVSVSGLHTFGSDDNPWGPGIADLAWVEWYPVTVAFGYLPGARTLLTRARQEIEEVTPGTPIWLVAQCHENVSHNMRAPTAAQLQRQITDGRRYLGASGIVFYPWSVSHFESDLSRDTRLQDVVRRLAATSGAPP